MNSTSTVNSSSRPKSMPAAKSHLAASGSEAKVPAGPIVSPRPGPTLAIADAAPETEVRKSRPSMPRRSASTAKQTTNRKKKPMTEAATASEIGRRL